MLATGSALETPGVLAAICAARGAAGFWSPPQDSAARARAVAPSARSAEPIAFLVEPVSQVEVARPGLVVAVVGLQEERGRHVVERVPGLRVADLVVLEPDADAGEPLLGEAVAERREDVRELGVVEVGDRA